MPSRSLPRPRRRILLAAAIVLGSQLQVKPASSGQPASGSASLFAPLAPPLVFGSSFGEYRSDHLHAGIDLSTGGKIGLPVHAAADGEAYRIKREWRGYGLALYLRHPDGRITVYAHLDRLAGGRLGLDSRLRGLIDQSGARYPGDLILIPPVPVRRGEVIAFSGERGVGLPHLHFEVRESESIPIDPAIAGLSLRDDQPPVLRRLLLTAVGARSRVGESATEVEIPLEGRAARSPVMVHGSFRASLECFDPSSTGQAGVPSLELLLDGRGVFRVDLTRLPFDLYHRVGSILDPDRSRLSPARFVYRLYRAAGNEFSNSSGLQDLAPPAGKHRLTIIARDRSGNETRREVPILVSEPRLSLGGATIDAEKDRLRAHWSVEGVEGSAGFRLEAELSLNGGKRWSPLPFHIEGNDVMGEAGLSRRGAVAVRLRAVRGEERTPWHALLARFLPGKGWIIAGRDGSGFPLEGSGLEALSWNASGHLRGQVLDIFVETNRLLAAPPTARFIVPGSPSAEESFEKLDYRGSCAYAGSLPLPERDGPASVEILLPDADGANRTHLIAFDVNRVHPDRESIIGNEEMRLTFPPGAALETAAIALEASRRESPEDLPSRSRAWSVEPPDLIVDRPLKVDFGVDSTLAGVMGRLGVYRRDDEAGVWRFVGRLASEGRIGVFVRRLGTYALLEDGSPPRITGTTPSNGQTVAAGGGLVFEARVDEEGQGLGAEGVEFSLDGRALVAEYDPDRGLSRTERTGSVGRGRHTLVVKARDEAGNESGAVTITFNAR